MGTNKENRKRLKPDHATCRHNKSQSLLGPCHVFFNAATAILGDILKTAQCKRTDIMKVLISLYINP